MPHQENIYYYICLDADPSTDEHLLPRTNDQWDMMAFLVIQGSIL